MRFVWTPEYSVGVEEFDDQHKHFFELANKVYEMADSETVSEKELDTLADEFGNYAFYHLSAEEEYFEKYGYPEAALHTEAHNVYRRKIQEHLSKLRGGQSDLNQIAKELADFSANWLFEHILSIDQHYTKFFNSKGIK